VPDLDPPKELAYDSPTCLLTAGQQQQLGSMNQGPSEAAKFGACVDDSRF
jgi:hypothetical protein